MKRKETTKLYEDLIVIKVGTSTLVDGESIDGPTLDQHSFNHIGTQINTLITEDTKVVLVSSGAIAAGYRYSREERTIEKRTAVEKQRLACLGQGTLVQAWQQALAPRCIGQLLFTRHELESPEGLELSAVTRCLLKYGDIPVANENDALSHEEITFGDNDTLAARFAILLHASGIFERTRLVILSDIDGVYQNISDSNSVISVIDDVDAYKHLAGSTGSVNGTGGMKSKFSAAKLVTENGIEMYVANGRATHVIERTLNRDIGTCFTAEN